MNARQDRALGYAALLALGAFLLWTYWGNRPVDLNAIYLAAHAYGAGAYDQIYSPQGVFWPDGVPFAHWSQTVADQGHPNALIAPYIYPPLWAALLAPLTQATSFEAFANLALVVFIGATMSMILLAHGLACRLARLFESPNPSLTLWVAISGALVLFTSFGALSFQLGQPQILVSACLVGALVCLLKGWDALAGGLIALAASIKLLPALFLLVLIMEKRWCALAWFVGVGAGLGALSVALTGWGLHQEMLQSVSVVSNELVENRMNVSVELALYHISTLLQGDPVWDIRGPAALAKPVWITWAGRALLLLGVFGIYQQTRAVQQDLRIWLRFLLLFLLLLVLAGLGWVHYLLMPALLLPALITNSQNHFAIPTLIVSAAALSLALFLVLVDQTWAGYAQVYLHLGVVTAITALLLRTGRTSRP